MEKAVWQKNTVTIIATYTPDFLAYLKSVGCRPGLIKARVDGLKYNIAPGKKCRVPVRVATEMEKLPYIESVREVI